MIGTASDQRLTNNDFLFYYITDRSAFPGDESNRRRLLLGKIAEAACAGVDYIQLREKDLAACELKSLAADAVRVIQEQAKHRRGSAKENRQLRTALLVNSRTDVAIAIGADGVHLRSEDISPQDVRRIWECAHVRRGSDSTPPPLIGVSCHSLEQIAQAAANGASFAVFAPVFEKKDASDMRPTGLAALRQACRTNIPVLALGGITLENARACLEAGASGIAAIRLFQENDIGTLVRAIKPEYLSRSRE